ncbi:MAG: hypothetical protein KGI84_03935 [Elusimicrobia bacterium]|nr:hypothetical protein [Elusimicrobiota bacterium]
MPGHARGAKLPAFTVPRPAFFFQAAALLALLVFYGMFLCRKIDFATADLGRHLMNGSIILKSWTVPETNLYSYTYPAFHAIDHHWGTGVIFFLIQRAFGFKGLSVFAIVMGLLTFLALFDLARRVSSFEAAAFCAAVLIPCLGDRAEIRPEMFSYLFGAIFLWVLWRYRDNAVSERPLYALPFLEILWVNLHIYFFLGPWICGAFLIDAGWDYVRDRRSARRLKAMALLLSALAAATLFNPMGFQGAVYPAFIFNNFGYRLLKNQSVWFIARIFKYPPTPYFEAAFALLAASWLAVWYFLRRRFSPAQLLLSVFFSAAAWFAVCNFTMFAYFALPLAAANWGAVMKVTRTPAWLKSWLLPAGALIAVAMMRLDPAYFVQRWRGNFGLGLAPGVEDSANFFLKNGLAGPVMNNYDNGGYLIYNLYPQERVFVDNRPEAYPASFFRDVYVPMQQSDAKWRQMEKRYGFNAIFFDWHDLTPWGQSFIIRRVRDPQWAAVYADRYDVILLKRNARNAALIARYELPQDAFGVSHPAGR